MEGAAAEEGSDGRVGVARVDDEGDLGRGLCAAVMRCLEVGLNVVVSV